MDHDRIEPALEPGDVLAGRFRVVRFLAQGGTGEVYEACDLELGTSIAVKTIRPYIAGDPQSAERFRREVLLARQVTHPNVCRLFDLFRQTDGVAKPPGSGAGDLLFLSMELLTGETLAARLKQGRMSTREALPLIEQMAAGLSAAHGVGIVHRDFKSGNVMLVPTGSGSFRAVVIDFGLARSAQAGLDSLTGSGGMVGTWAYMAPEQVAGEEISRAADIYALGVVMYEMVTGTRPFQGDLPITVAVKRLQERPPSPRAHVPNLDGRWERAILRCLERRPEDRFASAEEVVRAVMGPRLSAAWSVQIPRGRGVLVAGALAGLLTGSAVGYAHFSAGLKVSPPQLPRASSPPPAVVRRRSVAVLGFKNLSPGREAAWISTALTDMLSTELAAAESLRTIPGEQVGQARMELSLSDAESFTADTLSRVRKNLGTDYVVMGSYLAYGRGAGGRIRLDWRIQDTAKGETVATSAEQGTQADLPELIARAGAQLREGLGVPSAAVPTGSGARPANAEALRRYAEGLAQLRVFDAVGARVSLEKSVAADPAFPLAHAALARAWTMMGYDLLARDSASKAYEASGRLSRQDRLWIEGGYHEAAKKWDRAIQVYRVLWGFFPDNLEYGLRLAAAQLAGGAARDALLTVKSLRNPSAPADDDPRIDLAEAEVDGALSDYAGMAAAASRAGEKALARDARLLLAKARAREGVAYDHLGRPAEAIAALDQALGVYRGVGDRGGTAWTLRILGLVLWTQGEHVRARAAHDEALATFRATGNQRGLAAASNALALLLMKQGRLSEGRRLLTEALDISREIGDQASVARLLTNIAYVTRSEGNLTKASRMLEEALPIRRAVGDRRGVASSLSERAEILQELGRLEEAERSYREALELCREIGQKGHVAASLYGLAEIQYARADLDGAMSSHRQALALRQEVGDRLARAESELAMARVSLEQGHPSEGEGWARRAASEFESQMARDGEVLALAVLAQTLLAQDRLAEAQEALDRAADRAGEMQVQAVRLTLAVSNALVRTRAGKVAPATAQQGLRTALAEAARGGSVRLQFEIRLALGRLEIESGEVAAGRKLLQSLEKEAQAMGCRRVALRAAEARDRPPG
jgi:eukaryotic-like serine/threonine-protein kinase